MRSVARGFSLIELMVVIAIIAFMMVLAIPSFGNGPRVARERQVVQKLMQDFAWARGAAGVADASALNSSLSGAPTILLTINADCSWTTTVNGSADAAHSMTPVGLASLAPGMTCASGTITLPAKFNFSAQGYVDTTGTLTLTGASLQANALLVLASGSMVRTQGAT